VGGHKKYHLEGDALKHTLLVASEAAKRFGSGSLMHLVAILHDVGKIRHHVELPDGSFQYPHHSDGGADELGIFISEDLPEFQEIRWYVYHHIQPLFFPHDMSREEAKGIVEAPNDEWFDNLVGLVICDLNGSHAIDGPQSEKLAYLESLIQK
jgi:hypothetical protein